MGSWWNLGELNRAYSTTDKKTVVPLDFFHFKFHCAQIVTLTRKSDCDISYKMLTDISFQPNSDIAII
jgi:hypothetical protein